jgi:hypothetical protein
MKGLWNPMFYGFLQFDAIHDSTESFDDVPGNSAILRPPPGVEHLYGAEHGRTTFLGRNSRFGFRLTAPVTAGIKPTGVLEADFAGNQPAVGYGAGQTTEGNGLLNSVLRIRVAAIKLETDYFDVLFGQTWNLFGWQTLAFPASVSIPGEPGELFGRNPQVRLSKKIKLDPISVEIAVAAVRPPQRDSERPDGQAGLKISVDDWKGVRTVGGTGQGVEPLTIGVSGTMRRFVVPHEEDSTKQHAATGSGIAVDGIIPVIPTTMKDKNNSLVLTGEFATGTGIADQYTKLTGGVGFPPPPNPTGAAPAPTYAQNIDNGLVTYDLGYELKTIDWQSYIFGIQYYLPIDGKVWVSANYSHIKSNNVDAFVAQTPAALSKIYTEATWWDANIFVDPVTPVRLGLEYGEYRQKFADGVDAKNVRLNFNAWYTF